MDLHIEMSERLILIVADPSNKGHVFFSDESSFCF